MNAGVAHRGIKPRDKNTYWELWTKIVSHRDFMLEHDYRKLMSRSGLAKHDIDMVCFPLFRFVLFGLVCLPFVVCN